MALTLPAPDPEAAGLLLVLYRSEGLSISLATRMCPAFTASQAHAALEVFVTAGLATLVEGEHRDVYMPLMDDAPARREYARLSGARACRSCGCTDQWACEGGCEWIDADLCSTCDPTIIRLNKRVSFVMVEDDTYIETHFAGAENIRLGIRRGEDTCSAVLTPSEAIAVATKLLMYASAAEHDGELL